MGAARKRCFTVEEANQRLPLVRSIVRDIVQLYRDVYDRRERLNRIRRWHRSDHDTTPRVYSEELEQVERELERDIAQLNAYIEEIRELGAELKDPVLGLVDFPTVIDGRRAYLCWKLGEPEVAYWHELDAGYAGRRSLLERTGSSNSERSDGSVGG